MRAVPSATGRPVRLPEIVPIVFQKASRLRNQGDFTQSDFEEKLARLAAEELTPRGLELMVRDLPDGATRFLIKESRTGRICEMLDCEGGLLLPPMNRGYGDSGGPRGNDRAESIGSQRVKS